MSDTIIYENTNLHTFIIQLNYLVKSLTGGLKCKSLNQIYFETWLFI